MMSVEHHTIERDGYRWHVVTSGPADAPPALLLHGWTANWKVWEKTMESLGGQYRFIVPDHLGFGQSNKPRGNHYGIDKQTERSLRILKHFGYERARVMGHSMGGQMALTFAGMYPEVVERLIVVDPAVTGKLHPQTRFGTVALTPVRWGIAWPFVLFTKIMMGIPALGLPLMRIYFPNPAAQREEALYWGGQIIADGQVHSSAWAQKALLAWDVTPLLSKITAPTLALWGIEDYCIPVGQCNVLAAHVRDFRAVRFPAVGHMPMIEAWERYIQEVETFWRN